MAKNHNFGQILTFGGLLYRTPFTDEGQILCAGGDPRYTLTYEISCECVLYVYFDIGGGSCADPLLPMRAKFGGLEQTQGLQLHAKFHLNVFIVSAAGGQKLQFLANFDTFGGSCIEVLSPMRAKFGAL